MSASVFAVRGKIQRAAIDRQPGEDGRTYWAVNVYTRIAGIWEPLGPVVAYAESEDEACALAVRLGLGGVPCLGAPSVSLDGQVRGIHYAGETTGYED